MHHLVLASPGTSSSRGFQVPRQAKSRCWAEIIRRAYFQKYHLRIFPLLLEGPVHAMEAALWATRDLGTLPSFRPYLRTRLPACLFQRKAERFPLSIDQAMAMTILSLTTTSNLSNLALRRLIMIRYDTFYLIFYGVSWSSVSAGKTDCSPSVVVLYSKWGDVMKFLTWRY